MSVRAKMTCDELELDANGGGGRVTLSPVTSGSEENDRFYDATPGGELTLDTINGEAIKMFERGKEYYVDITPA